MRGAEDRDVKLTFLNLVNEFEAGDGSNRIITALEPQHQPHSLFHSPVILFNHVV